LSDKIMTLYLFIILLLYSLAQIVYR
jgi:hypothetical protein